MELDGGEHYQPEQIVRDEKRTKELQALHIRVVRISNADVDKNFWGVCAYIDRTVNQCMIPCGFIVTQNIIQTAKHHLYR